MHKKYQIDLWHNNIENVVSFSIIRIIYQNQVVNAFCIIH